MKASQELGERLKEVRLKFGANPRQFSLSHGFNPSVYTRIEKGQAGLPDHYLMTITDTLRVNTNWLITGEGQMFIDALAGNTEKSDTIKSEEKKIPFYDALASAGNTDTDMLPVTNPSGFISPGTVLGACTSAIRIFGNSMLEGYPSGTILGLVQDFDRFVVPGNLYVLETRSQRIFKRCFTDLAEDDVLICYSDNKMVFPDGAMQGMPYYPPFKIHKEDIVRKFIVTGSAREHTNSLIVDYDK
jgi:phage repressor protein C with HTH and peptisase S24 domain